MSNLPRALVIILVLGFLLRLLLGGGIFFTRGEKGFVSLNDSSRFYQTGLNISEGRGFSRDVNPPYSPSAHFPPIYPYLIAASLKTTGSVIPLIMLQIFLSSLIPLLVWKIAEFMTQRKFVLAFSAGLAALEPNGALWSVLVLTETIAVFFLLAAMVFFLKSLRKENFLKYGIYSGGLLGLSTLTRPNAQLLFIPALLLMAFLWWKYRPATKVLGVAAIAFAIAFFAVISPWVLRNYYRFGTVSVSTTGARNLYTSLGTSIMSFEKNVSYEEAQQILNNQFREKYGADPRQMRENPAWGPKLAKDGFRLVLDYPESTAKVFLITLNSFFTQDLYLTNAKLFGLIPQIPIGFSPSITILKEGPVALAKLVWTRFGLYSTIPLAGRLFWVALTFFALVGSWKAFREGGVARFAAIIFLAVIFYYASTTMVAGFSDYGRHRYPVNALIFILAGYGLAEFWSSRVLRRFLRIR